MRLTDGRSLGKSETLRRPTSLWSWLTMMRSGCEGVKVFLTLRFSFMIPDAIDCYYNFANCVLLDSVSNIKVFDSMDCQSIMSNYDRHPCSADHDDSRTIVISQHCQYVPGLGSL